MAACLTASGGRRLRAHSLAYLVLRRVLQLVMPRCRSRDFTELEIVVLRHEVGILRRQTKRPAMIAVDRIFLAAARVGSCRAPAGGRSWSRQRPGSAGIGGWWPGAGRTLAVSDDHRFNLTFAT